jgi:sterol desaturase/sphingolipid hydroxylase (fatty acid hydroxylase superfamily)
MEKPIYTLETIKNADPSSIIQIAVPIMLGLVLLEAVISGYQNRQVYQKKDLLASIGIGLGNLVVNAFMKFVLFAIVLYFYALSPWYFPVKWWSFALCIVWIDFWRYWAHRIAHEQRFWWCTHVTHHSSELYNFSVSFRLSWVEHIKIIFFIPVAIAGFDPIVFFICHEIEILYQFWIHTQLVKKLPAPIEYIFTTPSHHRVHHAKNPRYIDKNYGSTFIFWDRLFGTFQEEDEEPIYGITDPPNSYNPVYLVFHVWMEIWRDLKKAKSFKEAFDLIFGWPGIEKELLYGKKDDGIQSLVSKPTT